MCKPRGREGRRRRRRRRGADQTANWSAGKGEAAGGGREEEREFFGEIFLEKKREGGARWRSLVAGANGGKNCPTRVRGGGGERIFFKYVFMNRNLKE